MSYSRDLALAGELGTELLHTNDQLRDQLERQGQEAARRVEALEQEKHQLRRQLEALEDSWQVTKFYRGSVIHISPALLPVVW